MEKQRKQWHALWITESWQRDANPLLGEHLAFRRDYQVGSQPLTAELSITASFRYFLWINGAFVASGPARCYPQQQIYDRIDITNALAVGVNAFAVIVQRPTGVTGYSLLHRMGLLIDGAIVGADATIPVRTDATWRVREADWYLGTPYLCTIPLGFQEHVDGASEPRNWKTAAAQDGWANAFCLGGAGTPPWKHLVPSITRNNIETPFTPRLCWQGAAAQDVLDARVHNLAQAFTTQSVTGVAFDGGEAGAICATEGANVFVFDFGQTRYIRPGVEVTELAGAVRLEFFYHLALPERPQTMLGFGHAREGFCDSFTPHDENRTWMGLTPRGFRFLTVKVAGSGRCHFRLDAQTVEYPYVQENRFHCDDTFLQRVWDTSIATLRAATTDVIGEPARENVLWTFDACVGGKAAYYSFGDTAMWRHCLELVAQGIDADGIPNAVGPAGCSFMVLIDQALYWVQSCKEYYWVTGDRAFLAQQAPALQRLLHFCQQHMTEDDLFIPPSFAWHWVDWAPLNKQPYSMPINGMLLLAAQAANALANEAPAQFEALQASSQALRDQLRRSLLAFYDAQENCFRSHLPAGGDHPVSSINRSTPVTYDLHSNALACLTGLGSPAQRAGAVAKMLQLLDEAAATVTSSDTQPFGIAWTQLILEPIFAQGQVAAGARYLRRYFQPFLDLNAATWAEDFMPEVHNTAHGWGACVNSLLVESICGIRPAAPGWTRLRLSPCMLQNLNISYRFQSPGGEIWFKSQANQRCLLAPVGAVIEAGETTHISMGEWIEL